MSKYYSNTNLPGSQSKDIKHGKKRWFTVLKVTCWILGCLIIIVAGAFWWISSYLSPERITKIIEKESSQYLKADIHIGKLDYKLFKTYPWLYFELDSLAIISKSLENLTKEEKRFLPESSDSLVFVELMKGKVNLHDLLHDEICLKDLVVVRPKVNLIMVNDSVTNFYITKNLPHISKVPKIDLSEINVVAPVDLNFFDLQDSVCAYVDVESFYLTRNKDNFYKIGFEGIVEGGYKDFALPGKIPVKFSTSIKPNLTDLTVFLNDLSISLAGVGLEVDGEIIASKNIIDLKKAAFKIKIDDLFKLVKSLPEQITEGLAIPPGLSGRLPIQLSAILKTSYQINPDSFTDFALDSLPGIATQIIIDDAELSFIPPKGKKVWADDIYFEAICNFNPDNTEETDFVINELRLFGEGIYLHGNSRINNLTGEIQDIEGNFHFDSTVMKSLSYLIPSSGMKVEGHLKGLVNFHGNAINLGKDGLKNISVSGDLYSKSLAVNSAATGSVKIKNLNNAYKAIIPSYPLSDYSGTKLGLNLKADSIISNSKEANVRIGGLSFLIDAMDTVAGNPDPYGDIILSVSRMNGNTGQNTFSAAKININASGSLNSGSTQNYTAVSAVSGSNDELIESRTPHTPLVLEYNGGGILQTIMSMVNLKADVNIGNGSFNSPDYLLPIEFSGLEVNTDLNDIRFGLSKLDIGNSGCTLLGEFKGLGPFMTSYSATPLNTSMDIKFTNVDINQLAWGYYGALLAQGKDSVFYIPPMLPLTASDSICVAIPRNIYADIRIHSDSAEYMNFTFSPLSTDIEVRNGWAELRNLTIGTPYCTANVDWTYSTTRLDNIFMNLTARVNDFNFDSFYKIFPDVIAKAPELQNLSGKINAIFDCNFKMFPDMFMNPESLRGDFDIKATDMLFQRTGKIEKITHLMLIHGDEPIKIQNMDITGAYHDNLFQLNPFKIGFDGYQLGIAGVNNIDGDIYYHMALEKSPFHLPFGVSVFGKMKHPEIRVGGTHIDDYKSEMVSSNVESKIDINIMAYLRHGWLLFLQEAAKYQQKNNQ